MKKAVIVSGILVLLLSAAVGATSKELDDTIVQAESELAAAKKINSAWSNTEKFIEESKKLKAEGKVADAIKLAKKALAEAKLAQQQAKEQADAKPVY